jgi:uncharacterized membrane protein
LPIRIRRPAGKIAASLAILVTLTFLWRAAGWQNSTRVLMGLERVSTIHPFRVIALAIATFGIILAIARLARWIFRGFTSAAARLFPPRPAKILGALTALALLWAAASGILIKSAMQAADLSYREYDSFMDPEGSPPADPLKTGSGASLLNWNELGRAGRTYISSAPTAGEIAGFLRRPAQDPIRVYAGLRSASTVQERAALALHELERVGGFNRSVLVVIAPTGTGWVDEAGIDSLEYLQAGEVASVAMQYSYLSSPLSLMTEPDNGVQSAGALFAAIYDHWTRLPKNSRPRLYVYGLSLGALSSERSVDLFEVMNDPIQGALWSGPPFGSKIWRKITKNRNRGSPEWLPRFRDGSLVRFTNQSNALALPDSRWGPVRIVYLQYASDPVTFFDFRSLYRPPDWLGVPRGPDVSPEFRWYPVVTFLQLLGDMAAFTNAPPGYGHTFNSANYIDAWIEVADVQGWPPEQIARLKQHLKQIASTQEQGL